MRKYVGIEPPNDFDPRLYIILHRIGAGMSQIQAALGKVNRGEVTTQSLDPIPITAPAGAKAAAVVGISGQQTLTGSFTLDHGTGNDPTLVDFKIRQVAGQTGDMTEWLTSTGAILSKIRASDGAFVGPVVASGTDSHPDNIFTILGSVDPTKQLAFEVDGLTTATTRTLTVPDVSATLLLSQGTSAGQVLGTGAHTGGTTSSLVIEGPLLLGDGLTGTNFTIGTAFRILHNAVNNVTLFQINNSVNTPGAGAASGTLRLFQLQANTIGYTSGSYIFRGFDFLATGVIGASGTVIATTFQAGQIQCTPSESGLTLGGGVGTYRGFVINVQGTNAPANSIITTVTNGTTLLTSAGLFVAPIAIGQQISGTGIPAGTKVASITDTSNLVMSKAATDSTSNNRQFTNLATEINVLQLTTSARSKPAVLARVLQISSQATTSVLVDTVALIDITSLPFLHSGGIGTVDYSVLRCSASAAANATNAWFFDYTGTDNSRLGGKLRLGSTTAPTAFLDLAAGTTAVAPLRLASGTSLTTPLAGVIEMTTDDLFFTITTGAARKAFILDDGARLTSGKIPVATTNGRLVDLAASAAYTPTNVTTDRAYDANATTLDEVADVLGTVIADLQAKGILG